MTITSQRETAGRAWTSGPWRIFQTTGDPPFYVIGIGRKTGEGITDGNVGLGIWGADSPEALANARLIAAAPELFEALEPLARIARLLDEDREQRTPDDEVVFKLPGYAAVTITMGECRKALAALSRATGEVDHG